MFGIRDKQDFFQTKIKIDMQCYCFGLLFHDSNVTNSQYSDSSSTAVTDMHQRRYKPSYTMMSMDMGHLQYLIMYALLSSGLHFVGNICYAQLGCCDTRVEYT